MNDHTNTSAAPATSPAATLSGARAHTNLPRSSARATSTLTASRSPHSLVFKKKERSFILHLFVYFFKDSKTWSWWASSSHFCAFFKVLSLPWGWSSIFGLFKKTLGP
jgi:hypothetical protein